MADDLVTDNSVEGLLPQLVKHLRYNRTALREEWARRITEAELLTAMTPEELFSEATAVYDNYVEVLETGSVEALQAYARDLSERIIPRGVETDEVLGIVLLLRDVLARSLFEKYQTDFDLLNRVLDAYEPAANRIANTVGVSFVQERERIIRQQQEAIRELSTPVLQVREQLLILPIIGVLDSPRARQLTEQLLRAIRANRAKVVVIDITGVPTIDSTVANHLVQTVDASGLMGANVIITGLSSDIALTLVTIGLDLSKMNAVGDLQGLSERLGRLAETLGAATEKQSAEAHQAVAEAVAEREALVVEAETLAAQDLSKAQWKQVTAQFDALFARWQAAQHATRIPKKDGDELWKRFRAARTTIETARKAFFSELDNEHRDARTRKQALVERAESLADRGSAGIPDYRRLLDDWKAAGRAGKKVDDALWARFKAAGDVLYGAKAEADAVENVEFSANLEAKLALLDEAEPLLKATDRTSARATLTDIQRRWDEIGKVPREQVRVIEDRLRKIEAAVRKLDDDHWNTSNPEKQARSEGFAAQLQGAIAKAEDELAAATKAKDAARIAKAEEALAAQRAWLDALG